MLEINFCIFKSSSPRGRPGLSRPAAESLVQRLLSIAHRRQRHLRNRRLDIPQERKCTTPIRLNSLLMTVGEVQARVPSAGNAHRRDRADAVAPRVDTLHRWPHGREAVSNRPHTGSARQTTCGGPRLQYKRRNRPGCRAGFRQLHISREATTRSVALKTK
jgi:hypothetical protein